MTTGPERLMLEHMLDRNRQALIDTAQELPAADARRRLVASLTTPIGLIKHAAAAERIWFQRTLLGLDESKCDGHATGGDGSFVVTDGETLADVIAEFECASERSRAIAADFDLDDTKTHPRAGDVNLRFIYLLLIEDFARHAGHGDILREQIIASPATPARSTIRPRPATYSPPWGHDRPAAAATQPAHNLACVLMSTSAYLASTAITPVPDMPVTSTTARRRRGC